MESDEPTASIAVEHVDNLDPKQRQSLFAEMIANSPALMFTLCSMDGRVLYASPGCETLLGYTQAEMTSLTFVDLFHPDEMSQLAGIHLDSLSRDKPVPRVVRHRKKRYELNSYIIRHTFSMKLQTNRKYQPTFRPYLPSCYRILYGHYPLLLEHSPR